MWDIDNGNSECLSDLPKDMYLYESRSMKKNTFLCLRNFCEKKKGWNI